MSEREIKNGMIVKMNPFRIEEADREYGSDAFEGEREIVEELRNDSAVGQVDGSNCWRREDLLIKGVDYDEG